jgi:hypothetical protein
MLTPFAASPAPIRCRRLTCLGAISPPAVLAHRERSLDQEDRFDQIAAITNSGKGILCRFGR